MAGGKDFVSASKFYDTVFVIDPNGDNVFKQAKAVPIQFFNDGLPARKQEVWASPWGKLGVCICYDLSYTRVTDELVRQGAQALIVPTLDLSDWGRHQHELHARVAPVRAAEYRLPIFRLASSGISQLVDDRGLVLASAPFPGQEAMLAGALPLTENGAVPLDRILAQLSVVTTGALIAWFTIIGLKGRLVRSVSNSSNKTDKNATAAGALTQ